MCMLLESRSKGFQILALVTLVNRLEFAALGNVTDSSYASDN